MFCGVTVPKREFLIPSAFTVPLTPATANMIKFWRSWMYPLDPFTRLISGMVATELQGRSVHCRPSELQIFQPSGGQTCADYARDFLSMATGYIANPDATEACQYCQYSFGQDFFAPLVSLYSNDRG
jgi:ATP-binding cassette subfamily G (WHITE) protein 2 (SNQ2)